MMSNNNRQNDAMNSKETSTSGEKTENSNSQDSKPHIQPSETEGKGVNPGRTPGKAEGVEDAEERGNQ